MSTATCECGLEITTIATMSSQEHKAAHGAPQAWVTFSSFKLYGRTHLVQKCNGSSRTIVAR